MKELHHLRDMRNSAKSAFSIRMAGLKADLAERGMGKIIVGNLGDHAKEALDDSLIVAKESKGVIAGTVAVLALWFLRNPILNAIDRQIASRHADT